MTNPKKISWPIAKQLMLSYTNNINTLTATPSTLGILKGFKTDTNTMQEIIDYENSDGNSPSEIGMFLGKNNNDAITLVLVGLDSDGKIMEGSAYDFSEPCPDKCPENYPTSS